MTQQTNNMAPGQQKFPSKENSQGNPHTEPGKDIIDGANEEDQLDELKDNTTDIPDEIKSGAAPTAYHYDRETTDHDTTQE